MQRSGYDEKNLVSTWLLVGALAIYEPLTTLYLWLPPLFGIALWAFYRGGLLQKAIWTGYLYFFEIDHSLLFFSLFVALFVAIKGMEVLRHYVACRGCLKLVGVVIFYGTFGLYLVLAQTLFMQKLSVEWILFGFYMVSDLVLVGWYES